MSSLTKVKIYNLALSALQLRREVSDVLTDKSNEVRILNIHWDIAFESTLQDLDLDSTSAPVTLALLANLTEVDPNHPWDFVYTYPTKCLFLRRLVSGYVTDMKETHIAKRTGIYDGVKAIFTNEASAVAECLSTDLPLSVLNPMGGMTVAYKLAMLAAPLITGKGSLELTKKIEISYLRSKEQAQQHDTLENFNYEPAWQRSEFVKARLE